MSKLSFRKTSGAPGLLRLVRGSFSRIDAPVASRGLNLADCLMSGLAVFGLKYASLLRFDRDARRDEAKQQSLEVIDLEDDQDLQEEVLSHYHLSTIAFEMGPAAKSVINSNGRL